MKKKEIDFEFGNGELIYCPVTHEVILDDDQAYLSDAIVFYYYEPDFSWETNNAELKSKYDEYIEVLNTDNSSLSDFDKESMAMKLLLNELEKNNKNLELYTILFIKSTATNECTTLNFCIDMSFKQKKE